MGPRDYFNYTKTPDLPEIKILNASICDFKYIKHSHDEYAIGITTSGHQSFFCDGSYYKVPKGGIILINPEELHDGYNEIKNGYIIRMFKKQVGMTPYQYILDSKIKLACEDLELGFDILNIVEKYGFYDSSHFYKRFKGVFGITPFEYQKYLLT